MTDRSSEERSRFEKWWTAELLSGKTWTSADIENMELAWRAALEDRQEAAPNENIWTVCPNCKTGFCVPSEATPSKEKVHEKENEDLWLSESSTGPVDMPRVQNAAPPCFHKNIGEDTICQDCGAKAAIKLPFSPEDFAAPIPEGVQGKEPHDFLCPECDSHCCITAGGSKLICYHCYLAGAASVPEGVQGKEPQIEDDGIFTDPIIETAYRAGEAAGRRSAITETMEWADHAYNRGRGVSHSTLIERCRELQEKTK